MKITKEDLINRGIDPSLYNSDDMAVIERSTEVIQNGETAPLLLQLSSPDPDENKYRDKANEARQMVARYLGEISSRLNVVHELCSNKQSIFTTALSPEETDKILVGSMNAFKEMFEIKDKALDNISAMFEYKQELANIQHAYNQKLYNIGMLNVAHSVVFPEDDPSDIIDASSDAFGLFNDITEFINDLNDRIIIFDEALNHKLAHYWDEITFLLDFDGDGAKLNTQAVRTSVEKAIQMLKDVIER